MLIFIVAVALADAQLFSKSKVGDEGYHYPRPNIPFEEGPSKAPLKTPPTKPTPGKKTPPAVKPPPTSKPTPTPTRKPIQEKPVSTTPLTPTEIKDICKEAKDKGLLNKVSSGVKSTPHVKGSFIRNKPDRQLFYSPPKKTKTSSGSNRVVRPGQKIDYDLIC